MAAWVQCQRSLSELDRIVLWDVDRPGGGDRGSLDARQEIRGHQSAGRLIADMAEEILDFGLLLRIERQQGRTRQAAAVAL